VNFAKQINSLKQLIGQMMADQVALIKQTRANGSEVE
jgi:hypothetical protein